MRLSVISDIHIHTKSDPAYSALLSLLRANSQPGDTWILNGDIFELFVGSKEWFLNEYSELISLLKEKATAGVSIYYVEGNHDFQLDQVFNSASGIQLSKDDIELTLDGKKFYIAHGDLIDKADWKYQAWRFSLRTPVASWLIEKVPSKVIEEIGKHSGDYSKTQRRKRDSVISQARQERMKALFRNEAFEKVKEGYDFVVFGHSHDIDEMSFESNGHHGHYMNMGFPKTDKSYITWSSGDSLLRRENLSL